ncbi:unnamed protein product [Brassicogethes aeneus]|uniref:7tm 6 domain containing protein n=1 Tax=Brassicogethes aeneus TaxID=1431903 RepID=A0A9P0BF69_BRAAE|nr:unnamed protein product [Brassicogethes aeneus]
MVLIAITSLSIVGQKIKEATESVFDSLLTCPWYLWNTGNKQILNIFLSNCVEPSTLSMSHIVLDYSFTVTCNICIITGLLQVDKMSKLCDETLKACRSFEEMDEKSQKHIKFVGNLTSILFVGVAILTQIHYYLFLPMHEDTKKIYFAYWFVEEYLWPFKRIFLFLYFLSISPTFYAGLAELLPVIYVVMQCYFQTRNLQNFIENISRDFDCNDLQLYDDKNYQKEIKKRLIFCVKYHQDIKKYGEVLKKVVKIQNFIILEF